jgi:hypothetical protein
MLYVYGFAKSSDNLYAPGIMMHGQQNIKFNENLLTVLQLKLRTYRRTDRAILTGSTQA